jgi:branched-chain amino acid transport system permease protein
MKDGTMEFAVQQIISGLALGASYSLVALGFVLTFGVLNILNIAHVQTIMIAPMALALLIEAGLPAIVAVPLALLATVLFGSLVFLLGLKPFVASRGRATYLAPFIASFGISLLVENLVATVLGSDPRPFPMPLPNDLWHVGDFEIVPTDIIGLGVVALTLVILALVVNWTNFGRAMRAVAENPDVAAAQGISVAHTVLITVMSASLLGGISGLLFAAESFSEAPFMGLDYGLKGLVVMILGGVTSPVGAVVTGLGLGVVESLTETYVSSVFRDVITFALLFAALILRPQGMFAGSSREARP